MSDARNEKTWAGISTDEASGRIHARMSTARLRATKEVDDIYQVNQLRLEDVKIFDSQFWRTIRLLVQRLCDSDSISFSV
jgi:hypothetical protein